MFKHKRLFPILAFIPLLIGTMLVASAVGVLLASPADIAGPLPNDCQDVTVEGEDPPICCAFGYVYYAGMPVTGAEVVIESASGVFTTTTSTGGPASIDPYYASPLSKPPLHVSPGEIITVTAILRQAQDSAYNGATGSTVYQVVAEGQQVDVVIPIAGSDQLPIGTIHYIRPITASQRSDIVVFAGWGADGDETGAGVVAWEWSSDLDGVLSTQEDFQMAAYSLVTGTHTISLRVQDDEGNWSGPVVRELVVEPMAFDTHPGWQVIVFPGLPDSDYDARRLLEDIEAQGGCPAEISRWMSELGNWAGYLRGLPFGNFVLEPWRPYFLRANCSSELRLAARFSAAPSECITLTTGWNFVTLSRTVTAESACGQIAEQGGAVSEIDRWDDAVGNWAGHICGLPFGDFEMTPGEGYFIKSQADSVWCPSNSGGQ